MLSLTKVFATFGYFEEKNGALTFEGAEGAEKIKRLLESYIAAPPAEMLGSKVVAVKNFEQETFRDVEGDVIPKERMLIFELEDRTRIAVRGSGTEPKIKYYLFAQRRPNGGNLAATDFGPDQGGSQHPSGTVVGLAPGRCRRAPETLNASTAAQFLRHSTMAREIKLNGGEISVLKTLGFSGTQMYGKILLERVEEMMPPNFLIPSMA